MAAPSKRDPGVMFGLTTIVAICPPPFRLLVPSSQVTNRTESAKAGLAVHYGDLVEMCAIQVQQALWHAR